MIRRCVAAALLALTASCEGVTGPGDDTPDGFDLLIERRNAAGQRSFYTMSPGGDRFTPFHAVPSDARTLIPSPDGRTIAYIRDFDTYRQLWVMDRDGANRRPILDGAVFIESAAWSPDGKKLALTYSTDATTADIVTLNADGTGFVNLTPDPLPAVIFDRDPSWSSDGTRIAFSSNRSGTRRLWVMNADGTSPNQVLPSSVSSTERNPVWSPDTTNFIAVIATNAAGPGITFVRADGTDYKHVAISPEPNDPVWLPDGRLVYVANPTGDYDLYSVDRVSGATAQVTSRRDNDVHASVITRAARYNWLGLATPVRYAINRPIAVDIAAADVLYDGYEDVLVLSPLLNEVRLMRGASNGSLQSVGSLFAEFDLTAVRTGRITTDLAPDVAGLADSAVYVWRGRPDGPGLSTRIGLGGEVRDFALVDLDGSGRADIVSLVENGTQPFRLKTHTINPSDAFVFAVDMLTTRTSGQSLCAGDFNNDGHPDIAIFAGTSTLTAFVATGRGELSVEQPQAAGSNLSTDVGARPHCADFDNDGRDDLALLSSATSSNVSIHRYQTFGFGGVIRLDARASSIAITDIDRDGDLDLVMASSNSASLLIAKNRGDGRFDAPQSIALESIPMLVVAADLNGDSWPDVAAIDATGALVVLISRGRTGM